MSEAITKAKSDVPRSCPDACKSPEKCCNFGCQKPQPAPLAGEREKAEADAALYGTGFIVDGWRVAPHRVHILALRPQAVPMTDEQQPNPFAKRCYTMSESHLSGYRLIVGFERLEDAQDAHTFVASTRKSIGITAKAEGGA